MPRMDPAKARLSQEARAAFAQVDESILAQALAEKFHPVGLILAKATHNLMTGQPMIEFTLVGTDNQDARKYLREFFLAKAEEWKTESNED